MILGFRGVLSLALTIALMAAAGCATSRPPVFSESFIASINDYNMRQFHYNLAYNLDDKDNKHRNRAARGSNKSGGKSRMKGSRGGSKRRTKDSYQPPSDMGRKLKKNREAAVIERMEAVLSQTQYCKHSYFIIEKTFLTGTAKVFGECKAVAKPLEVSKAES